MKSIVVGFIDTPEGHAALQAGIEEARLRGGKVVVVHSMVGGSHEDEEDYVSAAEALEKAEELLQAAGVEYDVHEYVRGNTPAEDINAAVEQHEAGLIVIGIRRRSTAGKLLLGSNALEILHDATVPVLCVKARP